MATTITETARIQASAEDGISLLAKAANVEFTGDRTASIELEVSPTGNGASLSAATEGTATQGIDNALARAKLYANASNKAMPYTQVLADLKDTNGDTVAEAKITNVAISNGDASISLFTNNPAESLQNAILVNSTATSPGIRLESPVIVWKDSEVVDKEDKVVGCISTNGSDHTLGLIDLPNPFVIEKQLVENVAAYRFVNHLGSLCRQDQKALGVTDDGYITGDFASIQFLGTAVVETATTVYLGDAIVSDNNGKAKTGGGGSVNGYALTGTTGVGIITVMLSV